MNKLTALLAPLVLGFAFPASAAVATLGAAGNTNAFIFNTANTAGGGHSDGSMVVGGSWSGDYYEVRQHGQTPLPTAPFAAGTALYIGGSNNITNYIRTLSGDAYIVGDQNPIQNNGGGHTYATPGYDLVPTINNLKQLSTDLFNLPGTNLAFNEPNNIKVNVSLVAGNLKVYNVQASTLSGGRTLDFEQTNGNETIVINVTGSTVDWGLSTNFDASRIIWNFADATNIHINEREFRGTILAPNASVLQSKNINGTLIANNWTTQKDQWGSAPELHSYTFSGTVPLPSTPTPPVIPVAAPEPAGVMTMGGFLALALFSRRRQTVRL